MNKNKATALTRNHPQLDEAEKQRLKELTLFEDAARERGFTVVAGIDEAGRGPLAGPVVAAACIFPKDFLLAGVDDSKKLTAKQRSFLFDQLIAHSDIHYGVGIVQAEEIDQINIYQATIRAMLQAVQALTCLPELLLVDGLALPHPTIPVEKIIGGDARSQSIGAASIIAKETRDRIMREHHLTWPHYGFDRHKGYGTAMHCEALRLHGPCPIHRRSFEPVRQAFLKGD